jgi:hypothetical protein
MHLIGHIRQLQIQIDGLKKGDGPDRIYDTGALQSIPAARLSVDGVTGLQDNRELLDVHHRLHHRSKHRQSNAISFNFAQNYDHMRRKFRGDIILGCAGENLLIELIAGVDHETLMADLDASMVVENREGQQGKLSGFMVARPCVPFTEFVLNMDTKPLATDTKAALQFLDGGVRGYYSSWLGEPIIARIGAKVLIQA